MINLEKIKIELQNAIKNSPKTQVEIAKKIGVKQQRSEERRVRERVWYLV